MGTYYSSEYEEFCRSTEIKYIESGRLSGNDWHHTSLKAPYNRLYIVLEGEGYIYKDNHKYPISAGHAYIIPLGYDFDCDSPIYMKKLFFHFLTPTVYDMDSFEKEEDILSCLIRVKDYSWIYDSLEESKKRDYYKIRLTCDTLIHQFIDDIIEDQSIEDEQITAPKLKEINKLVVQFLSAQLKVSWLAHRLGMTHVALSKYYREMTGSVLKEAILEKLMHKAQVLLLTESKSIAEVAEELGYKDTLYFTKVFSKRIGIPPSVYRRNNGYRKMV